MSDKRQLPLWQESILLVVTAMVMAVIVKAFMVQAFYIPSGSMEPTMLVNDRILVQKVSYWGGDVSRGDIVVFDDPGNWLTPEESRHPSNAVQRTLEVFGLFPTGGHLIKRVVGVAGDEVKCCDSTGHLTVNGTSLKEPYVLDSSLTHDLSFEVKVPKNHLWVMGDNRGNSADSRAHLGDPGGGFVPTDNVVGKAWVRVWPWNRAGLVNYPETFNALNNSKQ
ncbi:MAG: signal peptidase I [Aeromicrobium sp.]